MTNLIKNRALANTIEDKSKYDFFRLLLYLLFSIVLIYYTPSPINKLVFLGVLPLAWKSKKDYFWLALFFIVEDQPGGLFSGGNRDDIYRLPIYSLVSGISFTIRELYLIMLVVKIIVKKSYKVNKPKVFFRNDLSLIGVLYLVIVLLSPLMGVDFDSFRYIAKVSINLTLFYSIFYIISNKKQLGQFFTLLFPFSFIALALQIYSLTYNQQLVAIFNPSVTSVQGVFDVLHQGNITERPIELVHILFINFTGSFFLIYNNYLKLNKTYLWSINFISSLSIFFTATRTWFIAFSISYIIFMLISRKNMFSLIPKVIIAVIIIVVFGIYSKTISTQLDAAWSRLASVELVLQGDITAGGSIKRYDQRAPAVMNAFEQSSIVLGAGFSKLHQEHQDFHVGYHNLLFNVGIIGVIVFLTLIAKIFIVSFKNLKNNSLVAVASIPLITALILNTGTQFIGFNVQLTPRFFIQAYILVLISIAYNVRKEQAKP